MAVSRLGYSQYTRDSISAIEERIGYFIISCFSWTPKEMGKKEAEFLGFVIAEIGKKKSQSQRLPWALPQSVS